MPLQIRDFDAGTDDRPLSQCARFDVERPFLFDGLVPRYATRIVRSVFVPMRDGVRLSTDFHIPLGARLPLPVVLVRTPYDKRKSPVALPALLPEQGFVYAMQDVRGRNESEGEFVACTGQDREDGYDTVEWLARQPWCNGRVGTIGSSYTGETSAKTAAMRHPAHRCAVIMFDGSYAGGRSINGAFLQGGVSLLRMLFQWFRDWVPQVSYGPPPHIDREAWFSQPWSAAYAMQPVAQPPVDLEAHLRTLPVWSLLERSGAVPSAFAEMMRRAANPADPYWRAQGFLQDDDRFDVPALHVTGPLERGGTSFDNFALMRRNGTTDSAREHQYLLFTPEAHSGYYQCGPDATRGLRHLGDTRLPYYHLLLDWFGRWLRDDSVDLSSWPKVRYYAIGRNAWQTATTWPPADVAAIDFHLHGGGRLARELPQDHEAFDEFAYDPADPTPSEPPDTALDILGGGYADRRAIEARPDVLVYTTAPLEQPLHIAGAITATLHVSSSAVDTDIAAVLTEVDAEGRSINITHGMTRLRWRDGFERARWLAPGEVVSASVDLWHAAIEIPTGHALRLAIASSHFPFYDRNLNTGGDNFSDTEWVVARNRVHRSATQASRLTLPVRSPAGA